jgi:transposase InsO family protein
MAAEHLERTLKVSERKACKVLNLARSTKRRIYKKTDEMLIDELHVLSYKHQTFGYRKIHTKLQNQDFKVGREKVRILRREHGLQLPMRKVVKRRVGVSQGMVDKALYPNHVWTYDFMHDQTEDGRTLKWLTVVDEFSRSNQSTTCDRSITSGSVINILEMLVQIHGKPDYMRSDNGPEFVAKAVQDWLKQKNIKTHYIKPGSPWENAYGEGFNAIFRNGCLDRFSFTSPKEAQMIADIWRDEYNNERPHGGLNMLTPAQFIKRHQESMLS